MRFSKFFEKSMNEMFLIFYMKLQRKNLKLAQIIFLREILYWCFWTKGALDNFF